MGRTIIKLTDPKDEKVYYLEWSSIVDAPVTYGMPLEEFKEYYKEEYGREGMRDLDQRMARVEEHGSSSHQFQSGDAMMRHNRAGENETCLSVDGIIDKFCRNRPTGEEEA